MQSNNAPVDIFVKGVGGFVEFGLPIKKGLVWQPNHISLFSGSDEQNCTITPTGYWQDNSIRWVIVQTVIAKSGPLTLLINEKNKYFTSLIGNPSCASFKNDDTLYTIQDIPLTIQVELSLAGQTSLVKMSSVQRMQESNAVVTSLYLKGSFVSGDKTLNLSCDIQCIASTGEMLIKLRLHNPSAAEHVGGKWDLGDAKSVVVDGFSIVFKGKETQTTLFIVDENGSHNKQISENDTFKLSQLGSGGENWQSPIHWDHNKKSTVTKQGFEFNLNENVERVGKRAEPVLFINNSEYYTQLEIDGFWQNFPITVSGSNCLSKWQLLANKTEVQGGESKTWHLRCKTGKLSELQTKDSPIKKYSHPQVKYNVDYINSCSVFPHITFSENPTKLSKLIDLGIKGQNNFFIKRERKDIYGWRHYGEMDADHEAVNATEPNNFISHYNNQYDPLMGMTIQYLHSANPIWLDLLLPLNQHIQDIDIYDTNEDKAEYNGGLMWHTDHYLTAETSTHRSNSKFHEQAYDGFLGGGGPGGQHCYTSGLVMQYRLFGDLSAKAKVEQLCQWIRHFYNGSGSIAERTFRLLTIDNKKNVLTNIGVKAPGYKYPLDRGTGNYLNTLIDCFDVNEDIALIDEMGNVVRNTLHPNENIELRDLTNTETSWFYTVYLQAVVRYLLLKETREVIDDDYWYARHAFLHYGRWMLENESFYLLNAEQLEFPNDTWCAQDIRKVNLFCYMYYFESSELPIYLSKANEYYHYVTSHLANSKETHFTRILALLMQSDGVVQKFGIDNVDIKPPRSPIAFEESFFNGVPTFSRYQMIATYFSDVAGLLMRFSFKKEWRWISLRIKSVLNK